LLYAFGVPARRRAIKKPACEKIEAGRLETKPKRTLKIYPPMEFCQMAANKRPEPRRIKWQYYFDGE